MGPSAPHPWARLRINHKGQGMGVGLASCFGIVVEINVVDGAILLNSIVETDVGDDIIIFVGVVEADVWWYHSFGGCC